MEALLPPLPPGPLGDEEEEHVPLLTRPWATYSAFFSTWFSNIVCIYLLVQHIRNYTQPGYQRYICRIVWIVPFYCTGSWLALLYRDWSLFFETPRDCYEAWVIYNFMALCMAFVGGPSAVVIKSDGKLIQPSWILCTCCMKPIAVDGFFLRNCKQGTLQFVLAKPFLAFFTLGMFAAGKYQVGNWSFGDGYVYVAVIYNFCYSWALFWMLLFYVGTEELLHPFKPLLKFFVFKTVIFLTFWQGLVVTFLATRFGWTPDDSEALQNWLICIEMFFAAIGMFFAFPHQEYQLGAASPGWKWEAFFHAVSIQDVIDDIKFQFNPHYKDLLLVSDGGPTEAVKKKKFRKGKTKKPAFSVIASEIGGVVGDQLKKLEKPVRVVRNAFGPEQEDEEGGHWHSAVRKDNILTQIQGGVQQINKGIGQGAKVVAAGLAFLPTGHITDKERRMADLIDSESDAEYDEENQMHTQLDDEVLTTDDEDDSPRGLQMARIGGRKQKLDTAGSSDEEGGAPRQQRMTKAAGERGSVQSQLGKSGGAGGRASVAGEADWAEFPDPVQVMVAQASAGDDSWAQFDAVPQPTISEEPQAAEEAASPAEQPAADPAEQGTRDLPDQEAPVALPGSATQDDSVPAPDK